MIDLTDPLSGTRLSPDSGHSVAGGGTRWPVAGGIPFLRVGRDALRAEALSALDAGDETAALALLLADQDDFAPLPPPDEATLGALITSDATFREAMAALNFGPVADYFAHRWSAPTFLSGLALAALYAPASQPLIEVACGTGQLLREFSARGFRTAGIDQVFAKLWLGRTYFGLDNLVCADAETLPVSVPESATVMIHDALYFISDVDKPLVIAAMARAARGGAVLAGHCHVTGHAHAGDRAYPLSPAAWQAHFPGAALMDDAALTSWFVSEGQAEVHLHDPDVVVAAVAVAAGPRMAVPAAVWVPTQDLRPNPLLRSDGNGGYAPEWPTDAFAREYADAAYLTAPDRDAAAALPLAARHARRSMIPLPPRW